MSVALPTPPPAAATTALHARYEAALGEAATILVKMEGVSRGAGGGAAPAGQRCAAAPATPVTFLEDSGPLPLRVPPPPPPPTPPPPQQPAPPLLTRDDLRAFAAELRSLALAAIDLVGDGVAALAALRETVHDISEGVGELVAAARAARRGRRGGRRLPVNASSWGERGVTTRAGTARRRAARRRGW
jgi:hypothetical protein